MDDDAITVRARFEAAVSVDLTIPDGYMKHYVALPARVAEAFAAADVERVEGRIDGTAFRRRLYRRQDGGSCLRFGMSWLRSAGLDVGHVAGVELAADPNPDRVDVPDELAAQFSADAAVEHVWNELTPGRQRTLVHGIERAKRVETRQRRVAAVVAELRREFGLA